MSWGGASISRLLSASCRGGKGCRKPQRDPSAQLRKGFPSCYVYACRKTTGEDNLSDAFDSARSGPNHTPFMCFFQGNIELGASPQRVEPALALHVWDWPLWQCQGWRKAPQSPLPSHWGEGSVQKRYWTFPWTAWDRTSISARTGVGWPALLVLLTSR